MDFRKLGQQAGRLRKQAEDKLGDRAEPENLKRDAREFREILAGDGSLAEKAKEAREKLADPERPVDAKAPDRDEADGGSSEQGQ